MQEDRLDKQQSAASGEKQASPMPPCCGSGCAVCVLDYWMDDELEPVTHEIGAEHHLVSNNGQDSETRVGEVAVELTQDASPLCCRTSCEVCVLDYPERYYNQQAEAGMLTMVDAIEQSQWQAQQMIARMEGESR